MPIEVTMPKLSPTMESGVIAQWLVKVGDQIKEGDVLAEIETDKATMPMKSYDDGTIAHIDHEAGAEVALGDRVMVLAKKGEDPKQVAQGLKGAGAAAGGAKAEAAASSTAPAHAAENGRPSQNARAEAQPRAGTETEAETEVEAETTVGSGPRRFKISPLARKMAESAKLDLANVRGSGPGGRIVRRDIESALSAAPAAAVAERGRPAAPGAGAGALPPSAPRPVGGPLAARRVPHSRMRKTIAQRMAQAKQTAPEFRTTIDVRVDRLVEARAELNQRLAREGTKLSLGDFVTKAVALALRAHPGVNASFEPDAIVQHGEVNIGVAVALPEGLIVPVLHNADQFGLREIRRQSEALAAAARSNQLSGEQLSGGTFTISNLGMYGIKQFDAILNLPEVGILAVGAAEKRPVVEGDRLVPGTVMSMTLTADHRAVDGALAAEFLQTLKALLEQPAAMLL